MARKKRKKSSHPRSSRKSKKHSRKASRKGKHSKVKKLIALAKRRKKKRR